jgi:Tfp pilus assembly protein PilO
MVSEMTDTRKWTVGAVLLAIAVVAGGWFLLISPQRATVADLQAQTQAQDNTNSSLQTDIEVLKQQNKDLPEKQAELASLRTQIPDVPQLPTYIREMQDIGNKSGVSFTSFTPAAPTELGGASAETLTPDMLAAINVDMVVQGSYFEITKFMNELETASRYTLVSGYTIVVEENEGETASAANGPPPLNATVNARIYLVPGAAGTTTDSSVDAETTTTTTP